MNKTVTCFVLNATPRMLFGRKTHGLLNCMSAILSGRAMDVYTWMSNDDVNDYDKFKKALLTRYSFTEDGYRKRSSEVKPETEEMPDQFIIHLKN